MKTVHVVVPAGIDDPQRPSGGNVYDRRLCHELPTWGWTVHEIPVAGAWPAPTRADLDAFDAVLAELPDDAIVLVDGLIASGAERLVEAARRLRVVVLVHMPDATDRIEGAVLRAAACVVTTSTWSWSRLLERHHLPRDRVWAAAPGVDPVPPAAGSQAGMQLLAVGPVTPAKGHDVLINAFAELAEFDWHCIVAGSLDLDPDFVASVRRRADRAGIADRLEFAGPLTRDALGEVRSRTDLLISASRREAYGMVVTEALAAGIPVIATHVGGLPEAVGQASDGTIPGLVIPADNAGQLAASLRQWLTDAALRSQWRASATLRRQELTSWSETARIVSDVLTAI